MGIRKAAGVFALAAILAAPAIAQNESTNRVATKTDWSVFVEKKPIEECWAVARPKETVNTRNGRVVAVTRSDILLFVFYRPSEKVSGQVTFTGGYPFASGSTVSVDISGKTFELYTDGEWAWPATPEEDKQIVTAMRAGAEAVLTARSSRGTQTKDTFSLLGFTAATQDAEKRCAK